MPARGYEFYLRVFKSVSHEYWYLMVLLRTPVPSEQVAFVPDSSVHV